MRTVWRICILCWGVKGKQNTKAMLICVNIHLQFIGNIVSLDLQTTSLVT